jgi:hypothetical protein
MPGSLIMMRLLYLAAEEGEHVIEAGTGGFWGDTAWIMLVSPFIAFLAILAFGKRLKNQGGEIAVAALAINVLWATALFILNMTEGVLDVSHTFEIARIGSGIVFELGWMLDGLSIMMYFLVNFAGPGGPRPHHPRGVAHKYCRRSCPYCGWTSSRHARRRFAAGGQPPALKSGSMS